MLLAASIADSGHATVWRASVHLSVCPMTAKNSVHGKTGGAWLMSLGGSSGSDAGKPDVAAGHCSRENPVWFTYAASGNVAVCLKTRHRRVMD